MLTTIKGHYAKGQIKFSEPPPDIEDAEVIVTFLTDDVNATEKKKRASGMLRRGMFAGPPFTTEEDFKEAEADVKHILKEFDDGP